MVRFFDSLSISSHFRPVFASFYPILPHFCPIFNHFDSNLTPKTPLLSIFFQFFSYMGMVAAGFFLVTGSIGFAATFVFVRKIYGAIKVD
jgi:type II secretory pathway component PulF